MDPHSAEMVRGWKKFKKINYDLCFGYYAKEDGHLAKEIRGSERISHLFCGPGKIKCTNS